MGRVPSDACTGTRGARFAEKKELSYKTVRLGVAAVREIHGSGFFLWYSYYRTNKEVRDMAILEVNNVEKFIRRGLAAPACRRFAM